MQDLLYEPERTRPRDPAAERRERQRFALLTAVRDRSAKGGAEPILAREVGDPLGFTPEDTFRAVQYLAQRGYLHYEGAGPRVRPTAEGIRYLSRMAGRRRSIRDA